MNDRFRKHVLVLTRNWPLEESDPAERLVQGALGLASELGEIYDAVSTGDSLVDEVGDAWFYWHLVESVVNLEFQPIGAPFSISMVAVLFTFKDAADLCGCAEKVRHQGHTIERHRDEIIDCLMGIGSMLGSWADPDEARQANIEKLSERYPDGFTVADSIARRDQEDS